MCNVTHEIYCWLAICAYASEGRQIRFRNMSTALVMQTLRNGAFYELFFYH